MSRPARLGFLAAVTLLFTLSGCGLFGASTVRSLDLSGTGNGDAGGTWTQHFTVTHAPWGLAFHIDCSRAHSWNFDLTLERMYPNAYFEALPIKLGWSSGQRLPARRTTRRTIFRTGEYWFIVRASESCAWRLMAPTSVRARF